MKIISQQKVLFHLNVDKLSLAKYVFLFIKTMFYRTPKENLYGITFRTQNTKSHTFFTIKKKITALRFEIS